MYPGTYAAQTPDRVAAVMAGTGETISYGELERRSVQLAHILHDVGLRPGDAVALLTENSLGPGGLLGRAALRPVHHGRQLPAQAG